MKTVVETQNYCLLIFQFVQLMSTLCKIKFKLYVIHFLMHLILEPKIISKYSTSEILQKGIQTKNNHIIKLSLKIM